MELNTSTIVLRPPACIRSDAPFSRDVPSCWVWCIVVAQNVLAVATEQYLSFTASARASTPVQQRAHELCWYGRMHEVTDVWEADRMSDHSVRTWPIV